MTKEKDQNEFNRRDFLKTSVVASVAATTVAAATADETSPMRPESKTEGLSLIRVTNASSSAPLRKPWENTIATCHAGLLLRADPQSHLAVLQRDIGYR